MQRCPLLLRFSGCCCWSASSGSAAIRRARNRTRSNVAFYETALRHAEDDATRATLLEALSTDLYLTDRLGDAIAAQERALELRRELGEVVAVGAAHTALSGFAWYAADRAFAERHADAAHEILAAADDRRALGFALARHAFLAAHRGDTPQARRSGDRAVQIADDLGHDAVLRSTASIGIAIARLVDGDVRAMAICSRPPTSACGTGSTTSRRHR